MPRTGKQTPSPCLAIHATRIRFRAAARFLQYACFHRASCLHSWRSVPHFRPNMRCGAVYGDQASRRQHPCVWARTEKTERAAASEPRDRSEPAKRRARARVGEFEGRSPSNKSGGAGSCTYSVAVSKLARTRAFLVKLLMGGAFDVFIDSSRFCSTPPESTQFVEAFWRRRKPLSGARARWSLLLPGRGTMIRVWRRHDHCRRRVEGATRRSGGPGRSARGRIRRGASSTDSGCGRAPREGRPGVSAPSRSSYPLNRGRESPRRRQSQIAFGRGWSSRRERPRRTACTRTRASRRRDGVVHDRVTPRLGDVRRYRTRCHPSLCPVTGRAVGS